MDILLSIVNRHTTGRTAGDCMAFSFLYTMFINLFTPLVIILNNSDIKILSDSHDIFIIYVDR